MSRSLLTVVPLLLVLVLTFFGPVTVRGDDELVMSDELTQEEHDRLSEWLQPELVEVLSKSEARTIADLSPDEFASLLKARNPLAGALSLVESDSETDSDSETEVDADLDEDADMDVDTDAEVDEDESTNLMEVEYAGDTAGSAGQTAGASGTAGKASGTSASASGTSGSSSGTSASASGTSGSSSGTSASASGTSASNSGGKGRASGTSASDSGKNGKASGTSASESGKGNPKQIVQPVKAVQKLKPYEANHYPGVGADACFVFYKMYLRRYGFMNAQTDKAAADKIIAEYNSNPIKFCQVSQPVGSRWWMAQQAWQKIMKHSSTPFMNKNTSTRQSSIRAQLQCGSCWAEASIGSFETALKKVGKYTGPLSVQQLIDCVHTKDSNGCNGGTPMDAFTYLSTHGAALEKAYPYKGVAGKCQEQLGKNGPKTQGYALLHFDAATIRSNGGHDYAVCKTPDCKDQWQVELDLINSIESDGPFITWVDASNWQGYGKGIFPPSACQSTLEAGNHLVELLGYGQEGSVPFWLVRNSWGTSWGENGFIKLPIGFNACGLANYIVRSTVSGLNSLGGVAAAAGKAVAGSAKSTAAPHAAGKAPAKKKF